MGYRHMGDLDGKPGRLAANGELILTHKQSCKKQSDHQSENPAAATPALLVLQLPTNSPDGLYFVPGLE
jgi:hypothetical protein